MQRNGVVRLKCESGFHNVVGIMPNGTGIAVAGGELGDG
jgi:hypothetical protein